MTPAEFSSIVEVSHTGYLLRKQIALWIADGNLAALGACIAFCQSQEPAVELSFQNVFTPSNSSDREQLPLFKAVARGQLDAVKLLLAAGCGLEQRDDADRTPLYSAFANGALAVAEWLVAQGADILAMNKWNTRVFDMVLTTGNTRWVDWFFGQRPVLTAYQPSRIHLFAPGMRFKQCGFGAARSSRNRYQLYRASHKRLSPDGSVRTPGSLEGDCRVTPRRANRHTL